MSGPSFSEPQRRLLGSIFERGAEAASRALTIWLGRPIRLAVSSVDEVEMGEVSGMLGPEDAELAVCSMAFDGILCGRILLVFRDRSGLALVDVLLRQPIGATTEWGELERSAACETANIVACAYLNALVSRLPGASEEETLIPSPPEFRHEFAGSLVQFLLMEQAGATDRALFIESRFQAESEDLDWILLFVPTAESSTVLAGIAP